MKMNKFRKRCYSKTTATAFMFACLGGLTACSDNDLDLTGNNENGTAVNFTVSMADKDAQEAAKANPAYAATRAGFAEQLSLQGLTPEDLVTRKIEIPGNSDYCLIETTVANGDNDVFESKNQVTRANITETISEKFSVIGYRGATATSISTSPWFYNAEVNADGTLQTTQYWAMAEPFAKFYGIYPQVKSSYNKLTLSPESEASPYVNIEVEPTVTNQKDLLTACAGGVTPIQYTIQGTAPTVHLRFQHAMTAVRFKVGNNLSEDHEITKIEIIGAKNKGKFTLPSEVLPTNGNDLNNSWSDLSGTQTFTLDGIAASTKGNINTLITGKNNDNYTFYMIPQSLDGVRINIYFDHNTTPAISAKPQGKWKAGTIKTYAISQSATSLEYVITAASPAAAESNETSTDNYTIQSYMVENGVQKPVKWEVIGFDINGDGIHGMDEQPTWLTNLSRTSGDGSTSGETGNATITSNDKNLLAERNKSLKEAKAVSDYNLSNSTGAATIENTANCYVISAPGTYRIPLVYGNAIKNQVANTSAYIGSNSTVKLKADYPENLLLQKFVDHLDKPINSPYINLQNNTNPATKAKLVWSDVSGIVSNEKVVNKTGSDDYLEFTVKKENMANGNAVVAVKDKDGVTMWSWHLWFAPKSALKPIEFTNSNRVYGFANEPLGWRYTKWTGSNEPRKVTVYVQQLSPAGTKKIANFTIQQKASVKDQEGNAALFQWGRKDALPGVATVAEGFYSFESSYTRLPDNQQLTPDQQRLMETRTIGHAIQHPEYLLPTVGGGKLSWQYQQFINLWSANENKLEPATRDVVKSIYDPSPVGYQMPDPHAFTDFEITGLTWNKGYTFTNSAGQNLFFPAGGALNGNSGALILHGSRGFYWTSGTSVQGGQLGYGQCFKVQSGFINRPQKDSDIHASYQYGLSVRPVQTR